ncbi:MAG: SRPBCC family protein [Leptolyngbya sp. SIO4C1]|nr:SRPBCC family protein [Leptolyngbya sp. SIO4C1]
MQTFQYSSLIDAPAETVWAFHERADILDILTPPWQPVEVLRREGGLGPGAISEFRLWLGPLPLTWLARHTDEYEPYRLFTDIQVEGPLDSWTHRHRFMPEADKTRLIDDITFALPAEWISAPLIASFVKQRLHDMFAYRHQVTQRECHR